MSSYYISYELINIGQMQTTDASFLICHQVKICLQPVSDRYEDMAALPAAATSQQEPFTPSRQKLSNIAASGVSLQIEFLKKKALREEGDSLQRE